MQDRWSTLLKIWQEPFETRVVWIIEKKIESLLLYFSVASRSRRRTGDNIMQSGRIYIGMMFSPVESVSTWPDAPFKCVRDREKAVASSVVFSIPNSSVVLAVTATTGNLFRRLIQTLLRLCLPLERIRLQMGNDIDRWVFERDVTTCKCIEADEMKLR